MKIELNFGAQAVCVPGGILKRLNEAGKTELQVLLALCADSALRGDQSEVVQSLSDLLHIDQKQAEQALAFLRQAGVIQGAGQRTARKTPVMVKQPAASADAPQALQAEPQGAPQTAAMTAGFAEYTTEQMAKMVEEKPLYKVIIDETQKICGCIFTPTEVSKVLGLADYLKLDFEHILMIFTFCKNKGKTSVHYIVKTAYTLYNEGIDNRAAFEEYVKKAEEFDTAAGRVRAIFGLGERAFSTREKEMIAGWATRAIPEELIQKAYEITVDNIGKASMAYTNKVLLNWHEAGYQSLADVEAAIEQYSNTKQSKASFETDEFFEAALRRGSEKLGGQPVS